MNKSNSIGAIEKTKLTKQTTFRLHEINKIKSCFHEEINQRKSCNKILNKYVAAFDYINCFKCNNSRSIYLFVYKY